MEQLIKNIFKDFCEDTNRAGGVLVHASIREWHEYLAKRLESEIDKNYVKKS